MPKGIRFAKQYDPIPRHIDEELAAQSVFGGLTASESHTFAIYILLSGQLQPHFQVLMGLGWVELKLTNPVRPGDALDLEMTILEKSKPDRGIVRNRNLLRNQKRETVLECISNISLPGGRTRMRLLANVRSLPLARRLIRMQQVCLRAASRPGSRKASSSVL